MSFVLSGDQDGAKKFHAIRASVRLPLPSAFVTLTSASHAYPFGSFALGTAVMKAILDCAAGAANPGRAADGEELLRDSAVWSKIAKTVTPTSVADATTAATMRRRRRARRLASSISASR